MLLLVPELLNTPLIESPEQCYSDGRAEQTKPPGAPPRRKDLEQHGCAWIAPGAPACRPLCAKRVHTRRQGGIGSETLATSDFMPCVVQSFQLVAIPVGARAQIAESGECQGENTLLMRERQPGRISNGFAQRRTASDVNRSARQAKFRENHRGCVRRVRYSVGVEDTGSVKTPEEHLSAAILEARAPAGQVRTRQSLCCRVTINRRDLRIESRYPVIGTHPKVAVVIVEDAGHSIAWDAIAPRIDGERARPGVKLVQPVLCADPHGAGTIKVHRVHSVVAQCPGAIHIVFVAGELTRRRIKTMQTGRVGAKPQRSFPVLDQFKIV